MLPPGASCVASLTGSSRCLYGWRCVAGAQRTLRSSSYGTSSACCTAGAGPVMSLDLGLGLVNAWVRTSGPFCYSHSNHRKGRMIMAVFGIDSHKDTLVGYLIDVGERLDNKTGPSGGAEPAGLSP